MTHNIPSPIDVPGDLFEALERVRTRLPGGIVPPLLYFESIGSTNDAAARLAEGAGAYREGAPDGTAVVAEQQTSGRGRLGRTWFSPPGAGLYLSIVVRPTPDGSLVVPAADTNTRPFDKDDVLAAGGRFPAGLVTLAAGVAFADALRVCTHLPIDIKWPNDLVIGRRKLAGILTEASGRETIEYLVVGVGINVRSAAYPTEIADRATSIEAELGRSIDRGLVLAECVASFAERILDLRAGRAASVLERWRTLAPSSLGARVEWMTAAGPRAGTTAGLDADGALLIDTAPGIERVIAGEIKWL